MELGAGAGVESEPDFAFFSRGPERIRSANFKKKLGALVEPESDSKIVFKS